MTPHRSRLALVSRVMLGGVALAAGVHQWRYLPGAAAYLKDIGRIPFASPALVGACAVIVMLAALAVLAGWRTRTAAYVLAAYYGLVAFALQFPGAHRALDAVVRDQELAQGLRSIAIAGGFLALAALGAGGHAVDRR